MPGAKPQPTAPLASCHVIAGSAWLFVKHERTRVALRGLRGPQPQALNGLVKGNVREYYRLTVKAGSAAASSNVSMTGPSVLLYKQVFSEHSAKPTRAMTLPAEDMSRNPS